MWRSPRRWVYKISRLCCIFTNAVIQSDTECAHALQRERERGKETESALKWPISRLTHAHAYVCVCVYTSLPICPYISHPSLIIRPHNAASRSSIVLVWQVYWQVTALTPAATFLFRLSTAHTAAAPARTGCLSLTFTIITLLASAFIINVAVIILFCN